MLWEYFKFMVRGLPKPDSDDFNFIEPGMLVFDIGANLGNYSQLFFDKQSRVVAVEPQVDCCRFLRRRFRATAGKVTIVNRGIGAHVGHEELRVSSSHTLSSFSTDWIDRVRATKRFESDHAVWNRREVVEMTTLDALILTYGCPDYLKIDVEGYEREVLRGLSRQVRFVSFEFTIPELVGDAIECLELLKRNGRYEFVSLLEPHSPRRWVGSDTLVAEIRALEASGRLCNGDVLARLVSEG